jgi:hypothetical protein
MGVGGQRHAPATLPPGVTRYPLYRRLGRPSAENLAPPEFDPRTVQPVASRYINYTIPAHSNTSGLSKCTNSSNTIPNFKLHSEKTKVRYETGDTQ